METITITKFERMETKAGKPFWVVGHTNGEATIGAWDSQLADYIEKDVGIGGSVSVMIEQKGQYTNITKVDLTSARKGENPEAMTVEIVPSKAEPSRDDKITAAVLLKGAIELAAPHKFDEVGSYGEFLTAVMPEVHGAYKVALDRLK